MQDGSNEQREPRRERTRSGNTSTQRNDWRRHKLFVWVERDRQRARPEPLAVELSYRTDQNQLLWSHTPGRLRAGEFVPTMHLSDRDMNAYLELLEEAKRETVALRRAAREGRRELPAPSVVQVREG